MPKHKILIYKYGGGEHPIMYGVKTDPNRAVPYQEKNSLEEVANFVANIHHKSVLKRDPQYENLSREEINSLETARKTRLSYLEK